VVIFKFFRVVHGFCLTANGETQTRECGSETEGAFRSYAQVYVKAPHYRYINVKPLSGILHTSSKLAVHKTHSRKRDGHANVHVLMLKPMTSVASCSS
jgi:hypothetical protein